MDRRCPVCFEGDVTWDHVEKCDKRLPCPTCAALREQVDIGKGMLGEAMGEIGRLNTRLALAEKVVEAAKEIKRWRGQWMELSIQHDKQEAADNALDAALAAYKPDAE